MNKRKVKLTTSMGTQSGPPRNSGDVIEVSELEATRLIQKGFAVAVEEPKPADPPRGKKGVEAS